MEFTPTPIGNTSGQGPTSVVPPEVKGWSWAAFLMNWIWAIGMSTWIGLLALIPYVGFIMVIILGVKGNEWAWQNRKWESVEQFNKVQSIWLKWGIALLIVGVALGILAGVLVPLLVMSARPHTTMPSMPRM
jgi:hypothetical protein